MAVTYKKSNDFKFVNTWTQLKDIVSQKSLYNESDYQGLTASQKEQYLLALYKNNEALANRMGKEYYSEYGDAQTRYASIIAESGKIDMETLASTDAGKQMLTDQFDAQFNTTMSENMNQAWVKELVQSKYSGNYVKFLQDYSEDGYNNLLREQLPSASDVSEDDFNTAMTDLNTQYTEQRKTYDKKYIDSYNNTKQYIREKLQANARQQEYENATAFEKTINTLWQMPLAWAAELGNIVEGLVDAVAGLGAFNSDIRNFVEKDIIAFDTAILNATDASWLSAYADNNIGKTLHEVGVSIVDMAPLLIPGAGQFLYYGSSAGKTMEAELRSEYTYGEALVYSISSTITEIFVESISDSPFFKRSKTITGKWLDSTKFGKWYSNNKNWGTEVIRQAFGEGLEEVVSGVGSGILHGLITGDFQLEGADIWKSAVMGGLVGGIMAGGNAAYRHAIVNNTQVRLEANSGAAIKISVGKAQVVSEYVKKTAEKVKAGKTLSKKDQARYDLLKDIKINTLLDRKGNALSYSKVTSMQDFITQTTEINKNTKAYKISVETGYFEKNNPTTTDDEFVTKAKEVAAKAKANSGMPQLVDLNEADNDALEKSKNEFVTNGVMTLGKMMQMFGADVVTAGIEGYSKWADKTIDEIIGLLSIGSEQSELAARDDDDSVNKLKKSFGGADFAIVEPKKASALNGKYKAIFETFKMIRQKSTALNPKGAVKFFATTGSNVSTCFFIGSDLYINANWAIERDIDFVKDIIAIRTLAQNARMSLTDNATKQLLTSIVNKANLQNRSTDIVEQDMILVLLYTKNNPLMQQLLTMAGSKNDRDNLIKYFSDLRHNYANVHVIKAAGSALTNIAACADELIDLEGTDDFSEQLNTMTADEILKDYLNRDFRAFSGISANAGVPVEYAKLNVMYLHFKNKFGFNKELDLKKDVDWLAEFGNPKNYSEEGYKALKTELEKYQPVISGTGFEIGTIRTDKSFDELLNYYLDQTCGLFITRNGILSSDDFVTKILNMSAIDLKLSGMSDNDLSRKPIGKVRDFVTQYGATHLSNEVLNATIYLYADSQSSSAAYISGTPGSGMQIFLNLPSMQTNINTPLDIGGVRTVLNQDTGLPVESDGKYKVENYRTTVSKSAVIFAHEIGHAIGMSLKLQGTFGTSRILSAWNAKLSNMSIVESTSFVNSIAEWLFKDGTELRPERLEFATRVNDITEWRRKLLQIPMNKNSVPSVLKPLATYLYFSGFAHEMYAGSMDTKTSTAAAIARTDTIKSRVSWNKKDSTSVLYLDDAFKKIAPEFIKILDGNSKTVSNKFFASEVDKVMNSTETVTRRVYSKIQNIQQLKEEFGIELDSDLINPDFWAGKLYEAKVDTDESKFMTRESLISDIESTYDCMYKDESFVSGFMPNSMRYRDVMPTAEDDYSCVFYNDGSSKSTKDDTAYVNESDINAIAIYHPAKGNRPADVTIRLNTPHLSALLRNRLQAVIDLVPDKKRRMFIAGGKTFTNAKAARLYLSDRPTVSPNEAFETLFNKVSDMAVVTGRQKQYPVDTIYITSDGKIYNTDIDMTAWNGIADAENIPTDLLGEDAGDNPEGITYNLSRLLDEKRVVRLYRENDTWHAYGVPNQVQDTLIRELSAARETKPSYGEVVVNRKLFVNSGGDQHVEIHGSKWKKDGFKEVEWKLNRWYDTICRIMTKYGINKFEDFKRLGFSNEFVQQLQSSHGVARTNTRGEKYITPGGIDYQYILEYIGNSSNTSLSRNILIENTPDASRENLSGDWKNNAHIRTIEDADAYYNILVTKGMLLNDDDIIYDNIGAFEKAKNKASNDPLLIDDNTRHGEALEKARVILGKGQLLIRLLNADSYVEGRGLDISTDGFKIASSVLLRGVDMRINPETDLTYKNKDGKEQEKTSSAVINPEDILLNKDSVDPRIEQFIEAILDTRNIADPEKRDSELDILREATELPKYGDLDMSMIRSIIANEREGAKLSAERLKEIDKTIERVKKYGELKAGSEEQLSERRKLIRQYEHIRKFRGRLISNAGSNEYYDSLLKALSKVGGFHSRMSQNFTKAYEAYDKLSEKWTDDQKTKYDAQFNKLKGYREYFVTRKDSTADTIHMEYPGYYEHYTLLYNMMRNWIAGHSSITQNYLTTDADNFEQKSYAAAQTEIVDFINKWMGDTDFRQGLAARERVQSYTQIKSLRSASFSEADLKMFENIPDDVKDISEFPKEAIEQYEMFAKDPELLVPLLNDVEFVTDMTREYGDEYIYNLRRLYNQAIMPDVSDFRSESKKDMWTKYITKAAEKLGRPDEMVTKMKEDILERMSKQRGAAQYKASIERGRHQLDERLSTVNRALSTYDKLASGEPASNEERIAALHAASDTINSFTWFRKDGTPVNIFQLSSVQAYKVLTALKFAYYSFVSNPKTQNSISKFHMDIETALHDKRLNKTIPGDIKREPITVNVPSEIKFPDGRLATISPKTGKVTSSLNSSRLSDEYYDRTLRLFKQTELKDIVDSEITELEKYREIARLEEQAIDAAAKESTDPRVAEEFRIKHMNNLLNTRESDIAAGMSVTSVQPYNITFDTKTGNFVSPHNSHLEESTVDIRRLPATEADKYTAYRIYRGVRDGFYRITKTKNILRGTGKNTAIAYKYESLRPGVFDTVIDLIKQDEKAKGLLLDLSEDARPSAEDFETEVPSAEDFTSSYILDDPGTFEPIETEPKPARKIKGSYTSDTISDITSDTTNKLLNYEPKPDKEHRLVFSTKDFLEDNAVYITEFRNSPEMMEEFVAWVETNPAVPIDSAREILILSLLNQVRTEVFNASEDLRKRAAELKDRLRSRGGRILGLANNAGLTPVDQMVDFISHYMNLTDAELTILKTAAEMQRNAIKVRDYKAAETSMEKVLEIVKKHEAELPTSCNIFAKGLTDEERSTRMHNIIEKMTSWRYFAMLGAPSTFFTKNIASNVIITGMDKLAEAIANKLPQSIKLSQNYSFKDSQFENIFGASQENDFYRQEYNRLLAIHSVDGDGNPRTMTDDEIADMETEAERYAKRAETERRSKLIELTEKQVKQLINNTVGNIDDRNKINITALTKYINDFIRTRHKTDGVVPTISKIAARANDYLIKKFGQYSVNTAVSENHVQAVKKVLVDNGLIDAIMNGSVSKYDRGYDVKISALRQITLDADGNLEDISEKEASILADTLNKNAPFKWELLNKYYRFIFKTMEWGDKKFIRPKIISTVEKLVASNMTTEEVQNLINGEQEARAKFEDFVMYATNDAMKTYFREDTDFYKKLMQLFPKNPMAQLVLGTLLPFPRMMINTMNTALSYSPVGFVKAWLISSKNTDAFTKLKVNKELGKAITGSSLITMGALLAAAGLIGFDDEDEYGGAQIIIADKVRISLSDLSPSAIPLIIGASITHGATEGFWNAATDGANALLDATILGEAINIFGGNQDNTTFVANSFSSYINQFIPSIFRHVTRTIDPSKKNYSNNAAIKVLQRTAAALPGVSKFVPSKVDPYTGEAEYQNAESSKGWAHVLSFFNMLSPAKVTANIESAVEIESKAVDAATTGPAKTYQINGVEYTMPDELYMDYKILRAKLYSQYAKSIIDTSAYQRLSLDKKRAKLKSLQSKATEEARKQLNIGK